MFPNPSSGFLNVNIQSTKDYKTFLEIINIQGQKLKSIEIEILKGDNMIELNIEALPQGVYILTTINADGLRSEKKVIKR